MYTDTSVFVGVISIICIYLHMLYHCIWLPLLFDVYILQCRLSFVSSLKYTSVHSCADPSCIWRHSEWSTLFRDKQLTLTYPRWVSAIRSTCVSVLQPYVFSFVYPERGLPCLLLYDDNTRGRGWWSFSLYYMYYTLVQYDMVVSSLWCSMCFVLFVLTLHN